MACCPTLVPRHHTIGGRQYLRISRCCWQVRQWCRVRVYGTHPACLSRLLPPFLSAGGGRPAAAAQGGTAGAARDSGGGGDAGSSGSRRRGQLMAGRRWHACSLVTCWQRGFAASAVVTPRMQAVRVAAELCGQAGLTLKFSSAQQAGLFTPNASSADSRMFARPPPARAAACVASCCAAAPFSNRSGTSPELRFRNTARCRCCRRRRCCCCCRHRTPCVKSNWAKRWPTPGGLSS